MAAIANVALTNTFDTWRIRSNQVFTRVNQFATNESSLYANTVTANVAFVSKGLATMQGRATVGTNLTVTGNTTLGSNPASRNRINGATTINNSLAVTGNVSITNVASVTTLSGRASVAKSFSVTGNTTLGTNPTSVHRIHGATTHTNSLTVTGNVSVSNTSSTLTVAGGSTLGTNPTSVNRLSGATTVNNKLTITGNVSVTNTSSVFAVATANVNLTGTGKTLIKTANTDVRGGTMLITSNVSVMGTGGIKFRDGTSITTAPAAGGGGSAFFNTTLSAAVNANVKSSSVGTIFTAPSTAGKRYVVYSIQQSNANTAYADVVTTAFVGRGANAHAIAAGVPIPGATALELLKKPKIMYPNDTLKMFTDVGTSKVTVTYATVDDTTYFSNGILHNNAVANTLYTFTAASVVESVLLVNSNTASSIQATVEWTDGSNNNKTYLAYGLVVPPQATVEVMENVMYAGSGDKIRVTAGATTPANALRSHIAGKTL